MAESNQHIARAFAFSGATLLLGVVIFFITQPAIPLVALPDLVGWLFSAGFIFIFFNMSGVMARRFCSRTFEMERFPYVLALILILPTMVMATLTGRFSGWSSLFFFFILILISSIAGAVVGITSGQRKRDRLIREAMDDNDDDQTTDSSKAPPQTDSPSGERKQD